LAGGPVRLVLEALVTWRDAHGERYASGPLPVEHGDGGAVVEASFRLHGPGWAPAGDWYRCVHARLEAQRGLNGTVALRRRASSPCPEAGRKAPQAPWRTVTNRASEGLLHGFCGSRWISSGGPI